MKVSIDTVFCKGCELCLVVCKTGALKTGKTRNAKGYRTPDVEPTLCVNCGNCAITCPEMAITVEE